MKTHCKVLMGIFIVTLAFIANAQRTIIVTGTVQDSISGSPVAGALVLLLDTNTLSIDMTNLTGLKFDSTVSGADGKFTYTMKISASAFILGYAVVAQGYQLKYNGAGIPSTATAVDLGTIKLASSGSGTLDTLTVTGKVVDSISGTGIGGALVVMSGLGAVDTASGNRVLTSADGTFSKQIIISELNNAAIVGYVVSQLNYNPKIGEKQAGGKQLDLGTILLSPNGQAVLPRPLTSIEKNRPDRMSVYALSGKLLYDGPVLSLEKISLVKSSLSMVLLKRGSAIVDRRQVLLTR